MVPICWILFSKMFEHGSYWSLKNHSTKFDVKCKHKGIKGIYEECQRFQGWYRERPFVGDTLWSAKCRMWHSGYFLIRCVLWGLNVRFVGFWIERTAKNNFFREHNSIQKKRAKDSQKTTNKKEQTRIFVNKQRLKPPSPSTQTQTNQSATKPKTNKPSSPRPKRYPQNKRNPKPKQTKTASPIKQTAIPQRPTALVGVSHRIEQTPAFQSHSCRNPSAHFTRQDLRIESHAADQPPLLPPPQILAFFLPLFVGRQRLLAYCHVLDKNPWYFARKRVKPVVVGLVGVSDVPGLVVVVVVLVNSREKDLHLDSSVVIEENDWQTSKTIRQQNKKKKQKQSAKKPYLSKQNKAHAKLRIILSESSYIVRLFTFGLVCSSLNLAVCHFYLENSRKTLAFRCSF